MSVLKTRIETILNIQVTVAETWRNSSYQNSPLPPPNMWELPAQHSANSVA